MAFDPDAFLAESEETQTASPMFDPDAFIAEGMPKGTRADAIIEPIKALAGSALGTIAGGYSGLEKLPTQGIEGAARAVEKGQQWGEELGAPETQAGQESTEKIAKVMGWLGEQARVPAAGIGGLASFVLSGGDIDQAVKKVDEIKLRGVGAVLGDFVFDQTESPMLSTLAHISPDVILSDWAYRIAGKPVGQRYQRRQTELQQQIAQDIVNMPEAQSTAGQMFSEGGQRLPVPRPEPSEIASGQVIDIDRAEALNAERVRRQAAEQAATRMGIGSSRIQLDPQAQKAIDLGWDPGVVASIKASSPEDWRKMKSAIEIHKQAKEVARAGIDKRPSDVAGDALQQRVKFVADINRQAGAELGGIAESLKGVRVDLAQPVREFGEGLIESGVSIDITPSGKLKLDFTGSDIEFSPAAKKVISNLFERMNQGTPIDAFEAHRFKKLIDEQVDYGKTESGYSGRSDKLVKSFRRGINQSIRDVSPEYAKANDVFAETRTALDNLQKSAGKKVEMTGDLGSTQFGQEMRKLMSNYNSRALIYRDSNEINRLSGKYGGGFTDDPITQILFADEMERALGSPAQRRTFESLIARGTQKGIEGATGGSGLLSELSDIALSKFGEFQGKTPEGRIKAMEALLDALLESTEATR